MMLAFVAFGDAQVCTPAPVGLLSWWSGDGNTLDSRSRNNGTLQNGATFGVGHVGQAFILDGTDDHVQLPSTAFHEAFSQITLESWVFPTSHGDGGGGGVGPAVMSNSDTDGFALRVRNGFLQADLRLSSGNFSPIAGTNPLPLNQWSHIAVAYDGAQINGYVNGVQVFSQPATGAVRNTANANVCLLIGSEPTIGCVTQANFGWAGSIDEPSIYSRGLSASEIAAIHVAGTAGKCKPTATVAPSGMVGWWGGDGNANDIAGTNNGTLHNGAGFAVGKVGQSFTFDGSNSNFVEIPDSASNSITGEITLEGWIKPDNISGTQTILSKYDSANSQLSYFLGLQGDEVELIVYGSGNGSLRRILNTTSSNISPTTFTHIAGTFNPNTQAIKIFVNGIEATAVIDPISTNVPAIFDSLTPVRIGAVFATASNNILLFNGLIDEASLYNRALTQDEIASIFNAGIAGKLKTVTTPTGFTKLSEQTVVTGGIERSAFDASGTPAFQSPAVVSTTVGDATITFPAVATAGTTQQIPLDETGLPPLPVVHTGLIYDVATAAVFTGSPTVCFHLPTFSSPTQFANFRVRHLENGVWEDRTTTSDFATRTLCSQVTSLSPFAITLTAPSAASVSAGGRVTNAFGQGISNASLTLTDTDGNSRRALTNPFGYYRFDEVPSGTIYVLSVQSKRYQFAQPTLTISVTDNISDLNFVAMPEQLSGTPVSGLRLLRWRKSVAD